MIRPSRFEARPGPVRKITLTLVLAMVLAGPLVPNPAEAGIAECYAVTDTSSFMIYAVPNSGISPLPTYTQLNFTGARTSFNGEGSAYRPSNQKMYLFQCAGDNTAPCDLYEATIDFTTTTANTVLAQANIVPSGSIGAVEGAIFQTRADGTEFLYAAVGEDTAGQIWKWNTSTWAVESGYPIALSGDTNFLTGLAYRADTDIIEGSVNQIGGTAPRIYSINLTTGVTALLGSLTSSPTIDGEGYAYGADGNRYMDDDRNTNKYIREVDLTSPPFDTTTAATLPAGSPDFESMACNDPERSDLGDAPLSYGVAVHNIAVFDSTPSVVHMGNLRGDNDDDPVAQSGAGADGDDNTATAPNPPGTDDEDGVTQGGADLQGQTLFYGDSYTLVVSTNGTSSGYLNAWFDLNADGDFADAGEQIATNVAGTSGGTINVPVTIPSGTSQVTTYARFRYSTEQNLPEADDFQAGEDARDGEVEDYRITLSDKADLQIVKTASPDPVVVGNNLTYTLTVTNNGPAQATNVVVTDTLPAGVTHVSTTPSQGSCSVPSGVTCELGNIAVGGVETVIIVVTVN